MPISGLRDRSGARERQAMIEGSTRDQPIEHRHHPRGALEWVGRPGISGGEGGSLFGGERPARGSTQEQHRRFSGAMLQQRQPHPLPIQSLLQQPRCGELERRPRALQQRVGPGRPGSALGAVDGVLGGEGRHQRRDHTADLGHRGRLLECPRLVELAAGDRRHQPASRATARAGRRSPEPIGLRARPERVFEVHLVMEHRRMEQQRSDRGDANPAGAGRNRERGLSEPRIPGPVGVLGGAVGPRLSRAVVEANLGAQRAGVTAGRVELPPKEEPKHLCVSQVSLELLT